METPGSTKGRLGETTWIGESLDLPFSKESKAMK
jgi:hypothetical protein